MRSLLNSRRLGLAASLFALPAFAAAPLPAVTVTPVTEQNIAPSFSNMGHVIAINSVQIIPRVTAYLDKVNVKQGSDVKVGQVLFTLQTAQYQAALELAQADVASAKAALENAQLQYQRAANLRTTGFEAESALDTAHRDPQRGPGQRARGRSQRRQCAAQSQLLHDRRADQRPYRLYPAEQGRPHDPHDRDDRDDQPARPDPDRVPGAEHQPDPGGGAGGAEWPAGREIRDQHRPARRPALPVQRPYRLPRQ